MNTTQIRCFLTVAKLLSFTEAAKALFMAQPALSKQIAMIEQELDMQLFDRTRRYVRLTPQGEILYHELQNIVKLTTAAINKARSIGIEQGGTLSVCVTSDELPKEYMPEVISVFMSSHANVQLDISVQETAALREGLSKGVYDLAVAMDFEIAGIEHLEIRKLAEQRRDFVISRRHPLAKMDHITISDLTNELFISVDNEELKPAIEKLEEEFNRAGYKPKGLMNAPNVDTMHMWAAAGHGVALVDVKRNAWMKDLVHVIKLPIDTSSSLVAAWRKNNQNPYIQVFLNQLVDTLPPFEGDA
jgi:DNA-binding transcriptional LysR family regulator